MMEGKSQAFGSEKGGRLYFKTILISDGRYRKFVMLWQTLFVFSVMDWIYHATEVHVGESFFNANDVDLFLMIFPRISLHLKLQPVSKMLRHSHGKTTFLASNCSWSQVCKIKYWLPSSLPFKVVPPSFEYGLVLLATLIRGGGGITSTRSWTGHLCQNTVRCLKYFCNWL